MMISSARPAAASGNSANADTTTATRGADSSGAPFDSVLALETIAAEANAAQLDLSTACQQGGLEELPEDLLADDDADTNEGDEVALGPLALLGLLVNAAAVPHATAG